VQDSKDQPILNSQDKARCTRTVLELLLTPFYFK
jgi:hypothetical protein